MPDESSYPNNHGDILRSYHLDDVSEENVDALWRQLLVYKTFADNDVSGARARRVEAEATREQAQVEAIRSTQLMCARMKSEAELELQEASKVREKAHIALEDAHAEIEKSKEAKAQAEKERQKIIAEAQKKAQEIIDASQEIAQRETTQLRLHALTKVKAIMSRVPDMRQQAQQRLAFETASRAQELRDFLQAVQRDLLFLSQLKVVRELVRAEAIGGSEQVAYLRKQAEEELLIFSQGKRAYYQVRYLNSRGRDDVSQVV